MDDSAKYLIHADISADGVVERSDVVGAVFGQTEGLLGEELDLRDLQQSSKVGRIDVQIDSKNGRSAGDITIASSLDKVETAILAASLETIDRVGPCRAEVHVIEVEDVRAAKRREIVERAKELLMEAFDESVMDSREILEEVRGSVRVEEVVDYRGLPAGPRVQSSDAIIVVEGRADVLTLLRYGVKNVIAVEGTNVPDAVADLSQERTVTAFLDGDRGGELILRELRQVGSVDYVAFAPEGRSVEDLASNEVMSALRGKVAVEDLSEDNVRPASESPGPRNASSKTAESATAQAPERPESATETDAGEPTGDEAGAVQDDEAETAEGKRDGAEADESDAGSAEGSGGESTAGSPATDEPATDEPAANESPSDGAANKSPSDGAANTGTTVDEAQESESDSAETQSMEPAVRSLREHSREIIEEETGRARLLDTDLAVLSEIPAEETFDALTETETVPYAVVLDAKLPQRVLDVAAQYGVEHLIARETGEFVKKPVDVRVRTAVQLLEQVPAS